MSSPWFPLYAPDFLASTMSMSPEVVGAYVRLLCWSWMNGSIPDDPAMLNRITGGITPEGWGEIRSRLVPDGHRDGDRDGDRAQGWVHPRMERERERTNNIQKARRDAAKATNAKRRSGQRDGDRDGERSGQRDGDRSGDRVYPQPQPQVQKPPHPTGGGAGGGEGISAKQGSKPAAVSPARGQGSTEARPKRSDGSTPHPTTSDAPTGISGDVALRDPTPHEMGRITRWPGNRILPPEAVAAQQRGYIKGLREKGVGPDLIVAAWNRALTEWGERGINPYEFLRKTLLADWEGVRNADAVMRHRLGLKEQVA